MFIEFDLANAEWVVTAYLAGDENMLEIISSGISPHIATGALISGASEEFVEEEYKLVGMHTDPDMIRTLRKGLKAPPGAFMPRSMSIRQAGKKSNHGLNYGMRYRRFALENEMPETDAKPICEAYSTKAYPGLQDYWEDTKRLLRANNRTLENPFGRKARLLGEWDHELFMAAYAFRPQSTVFDVCRTGMVSAFLEESRAFQPACLAAQVHDSLLYDYRSNEIELIWEFCMKMQNSLLKPELEIVDPHGTSRRLALGVDIKAGWNWGEMFPIRNPQDFELFLGIPGPSLPRRPSPPPPWEEEGHTSS